MGVILVAAVAGSGLSPLRVCLTRWKRSMARIDFSLPVSDAMSVVEMSKLDGLGFCLRRMRMKKSMGEDKTSPLGQCRLVRLCGSTAAEPCAIKSLPTSLVVEVCGKALIGWLRRVGQNRFN